MEESWENWHLHSELDVDDEVDEFLREILLQQPPPQAFSLESENDYYNSVHVQNDTVSAAANDNIVLATNGTNSIASNSKTTGRLSSPKRYILSFDNSTMIPATPETCVYSQLVGSEGQRDSRSSSSKRSRESQKGEEKKSTAAVKQRRSGSQTMDHVTAERKRRQDLTEKFIALSATIPGLSKTDKTSVLEAAIDYVKQLQERVQELEKHDKNEAASVIVIKKPDSCGINNGEDINTSGETSYDHDYCNNNINILPEIEARVMGKEVLIEMHCEKEIGIEHKLLNHVENLQLFVTGSSVLPFGNSTLSVTIIAEMGEQYKLTANDLAKSLRQVLLKSQVACDSDLC